MKRERELVLPANEAREKLSRTTRRSLLTGGLAAVGGYGLYRWTVGAADIDNVPGPQRHILDWNGRLARAYLSDHGLMPTYSPSEVGGVKPNGHYGLAAEISPATWKVRVEHEEGNLVNTYSLADIRAMPRTDLVTRFCCIEGWSGIAHWTGIPFADFTRAALPKVSKLPAYVYMATSDEEYYVGLDMKSAMHPQTLLAYEQNGKPLEVRRGAPLRLAIPVKYGIKNIKQIALIRYTDTRPDDYWAQEGYDWFAGL